MKNHDSTKILKNAMGTVFLLAGAFFVCFVFLSMRAVFADPIAPTSQTILAQPQTVGSVNHAVVSSRNTGRTVNRGQTQSSPSTTDRQVRGVSLRPVVATRAQGTTTRNVISRQPGSVTRTNAGRARSVRPRTATPARVSLQGATIRGTRVQTGTPYNYNSLADKLYTGNYSNIIDPTTGLISAAAYSNCLQSYYTCMDEICTARNPAQRRCACAGRVKAFADAETSLETANEELIKASGELALLIATKGKDVSSAFQLTDAEKVMNCVSWQEMNNQYKENSKEARKWCNDHGIYYMSDASGDLDYNNPIIPGKDTPGEDTGHGSCNKPSYCSSGGNSFGFNVDSLVGSGSDILASLKSWADAKENTITILKTDENATKTALDRVGQIVGAMSGISDAFSNSNELKDSLAETWGYELFEYAHNNVCNRVLDSCFNGIYEACGTPPNGHQCSNGQAQCPYNYNSYVVVSNSGNYELNFIDSNSGYSASNSAACYGYTSTDPYVNLRGPVAEARRSILQKYALDANADCDAYGEQLRRTAQNIGYQKTAAQQALQQKRMEFANQEKEASEKRASEAIDNYNLCLSEILECYDAQASAHSGNTGAVWDDTRIKTYCQQISNIPHCYEEMVCIPTSASFKKVIDVADDPVCLNSKDPAKNTCRNVVTLYEILDKAADDGENVSPDKTGPSSKMREQCLRYTATPVREWTRPTTSEE